MRGVSEAIWLTDSSSAKRSGRWISARERRGAVEIVGSLDDATMAEVMARVLVVIGAEAV